jgi:hypothetical protein
MIVAEKVTKSKRTWILAACVTVLVLGGVAAWFFWPSTSLSVQGQWSGTVTISSPKGANQTSPALASLMQTGQQITGTLTTDHPTPVSGSIQGNTVTLNANQTTLTLKLANQHLTGTAILQESGQSTTIAIDLSRVSSSPSSISSAPATSSTQPASLQQVSTTVPPATTAPAQPVAVPAPAAQSVPAEIVLGISSLSQTNGVAVAPPADPNSMYGTDMLQDQHAIDANGQWSETPVTGPERFAAWSFSSAGGKFQVVATYAAAQSRPLNLSLNGAVVFPGAFSTTTGGWYPQNRMNLPVGSVTLVPGVNTIRLSCPSNQAFPHVKELVLTQVQGN